MRIEWLVFKQKGGLFLAPLTLEEFLTLAKNNNLLFYKKETSYKNKKEEVIAQTCIFEVRNCLYQGQNLIVRLTATRPQEINFLDELKSSTRLIPVTIRDILDIGLRAFICIDFDPENIHGDNVFCNPEIHNFINETAALIVEYEKMILAGRKATSLLKKLPLFKEKYLDEEAILEINIDSKTKHELIDAINHADSADSLRSVLIKIVETALHLLKTLEVQERTAFNKKTPEEHVSSNKIAAWAHQNQTLLNEWITSKELSSISLKLELADSPLPDDKRKSFGLRDKIYLFIKQCKEFPDKENGESIEKILHDHFDKQDSVISKLQSLEDLYNVTKGKSSKTTVLLQQKYQTVLNEIAVIIKNAHTIQELKWLLDELEIAKSHQLPQMQKTHKIRDLTEEIMRIPYRYAPSPSRMEPGIYSRS